MTVSEWLQAKVDSHGIYSVNLLKSLPPPVAYDEEGKFLFTEGKSMGLPVCTFGELLRRHGQLETGDPKGVEPPIPGTDLEEEVISGYVLSSYLDQLLTGEDGGAEFHGRGFAHRARIKHLAERGF